MTPLRLASRTGLLTPVVLAAALALSACEGGIVEAPAAVGDPSTVMVVTDSSTFNGPVGDALRATLGRPLVPLPGGPGLFRLDLTPLARGFYDQLRRQRFVVFAAPLDDTTAIARYLAARMDSTGREAVRAGRAFGVTLQEDVWARGQLVVFATAATDSALADVLRERLPALLPRFEEVAREATAAEMFERAEQTALADSLLDRHGFAVRLQHDYLPVQDTALDVLGRPGRFVRYRRVLTDTWRDFFVYYEDADGPARYDSAAVERLTDELLRRMVRGTRDSSYVEVERLRPVRSDTVGVGGRRARRSTGLWRMTEDLMGGPFVRYTFYEPAQRRFYLYYGMVFAPQPKVDKRAFLRQMQAIAHTFRTREDAVDGGP